MKRLILQVAMSVTLLGGYAGMGLAQGTEEQELHTAGQHLDQETTGKAKASHVEALSQQFNVDKTAWRACGRTNKGGEKSLFGSASPKPS
ncbi:MAG TPA: hypothetical protein VFX56_07295 [Nitrospira sp.]|nr:hypothetical protein [Nitrospira sp.]